MPKGSKNRREEITQLLEQAILQGHVKPGTRLPAEMKIARALGVSQASVREALMDLESRGLIKGYHNRSSYVIKLDTEELMHIHQVRRELEPLACALASTHLTGETIAALEGSLREMRAAAQSKDFLAYSTADLTFHRLIWQAQPNRTLEKMLLLLCLPLFAYDLVLRYSTPHLDYERVIKQHDLLLSALRTGDFERVRRITARLVERWTRQDLADFERIPQAMREATGNDGDAGAFLALLAGSGAEGKGAVGKEAEETAAMG